jgi:prepilin-type N-terminal cleavage/methylation domain-containing protein
MMLVDRVDSGGGMLRDGKGFTLVEVLTVIFIIGALMGIAAINYSLMQKRYAEEQQVKGLFTDLLETRVRAMQHGRSTFVSLASNTFYSTYEDTDPTPDGEGNLTGADTLLKSVNLMAAHTWVKSIPTATLVTFTDKGLLSSGTPTLWIRIDPSAGAEYDCVVINEIKTGMGKINGTNCVVK